MAAISRIYPPFALGVRERTRSTETLDAIRPTIRSFPRGAFFDSVRLCDVVSGNRRRPRADSQAPEVRYANDDAGSASS